MSKFAKVLVTIGAIFVFIILFAAVVGTREAGGHKTPGILGLILFAAVFGAVKAIWKKPKDNNGDNKKPNDTSILQK